MSSDSESEYRPSTPPSPSALSFDSSASSPMESDADSNGGVNDFTSDSANAKAPDSSAPLPPYTFSALVVQANDRDQGVVVLENPFVDRNLHAALAELALPGVDRVTLLRHYIASFESSHDVAEYYLTAALADEAVLREVVDKYAETLEAERVKGAVKGINVEEITKEVEAIFAGARMEGAGAAGEIRGQAERLSKTLAGKVDEYAYVITKYTDYPKRAKAITALLQLGERVLDLGKVQVGDPGEEGGGGAGAGGPGGMANVNNVNTVMKQVMDRGVVGKKLGLALRKLVKEAGWPEDGKKQWGTMKRTGMAGKMKALMDQWEDVKDGSGGLTELFPDNGGN